MIQADIAVFAVAITGIGIGCGIKDRAVKKLKPALLLKRTRNKRGHTGFLWERQA